MDQGLNFRILKWKMIEFDFGGQVHACSIRRRTINYENPVLIIWKNRNFYYLCLVLFKTVKDYTHFWMYRAHTKHRHSIEYWSVVVHSTRTSNTIVLLSLAINANCIARVLVHIVHKLRLLDGRAHKPRTGIWMSKMPEQTKKSSQSILSYHPSAHQESKI